MNLCLRVLFPPVPARPAVLALSCVSVASPQGPKHSTVLLLALALSQKLVSVSAGNLTAFTLEEKAHLWLRVNKYKGNAKKPLHAGQADRGNGK